MFYGEDISQRGTAKFKDWHALYAGLNLFKKTMLAKPKLTSSQTSLAIRCLKYFAVYDEVYLRQKVGEICVLVMDT